MRTAQSAKSIIAKRILRGESATSLPDVTGISGHFDIYCAATLRHPTMSRIAGKPCQVPRASAQVHGSASCLRMAPPRVPGQWRRSRRGRVGTRCTGVAPEPVGQALFECCVPAVRFTVAIAVYIQTPGAILSLSGPFDADDSCDSAHDDQQQPHGRLLMARSYERLHLLIYSSLCTIKRGGSPPTSPSWRSYCAGIKSQTRCYDRRSMYRVSIIPLNKTTNTATSA